MIRNRIFPPVCGTLAALMLLASCSSETPQAESVRWTCAVFYQPARSIWTREVAFVWDLSRSDKPSKPKLLQINVDNSPVQSFYIEGKQIATHLDNERISLDVSNKAWSSDFRGQAQGQGPCTLK